MNTPTIRELLEDKTYRAYMKKAPVLPKNLQWGTPWRVWGLTTKGKWRTATFETYKEAWTIVVRMIRDLERYRDACIVSQRFFFEPPQGVYLDPGLEWCGRCRRPTQFAWLSNGHHALRKATLSEDDPYRCVYCGVRRAAWVPS